MQPEVLLIATLPDVEVLAAEMTTHLRVQVEHAPTPRQALATLRQTTFSVVVIEQSLAEQDPVWAESIWQNADLAVPIEFNFSISSRSRLVREVRTALHRRARELAFARTEAAAAIANQLKGSITGLLLQTQLTLQEPTLPHHLVPRLRHLVDLASGIRERLRRGLRTTHPYPPLPPPQLALFPLP